MHKKAQSVPTLELGVMTDSNRILNVGSRTAASSLKQSFGLAGKSGKSTAPSRTFFWESLLAVCIVPCVLAIACYVNGLPGEFVHDDVYAIENNRDVRGKDPVFQVFQNDFWGRSMVDPRSHKSYRPLTVLSFRYGKL
ncbi:transmembrane and TPR repeat-containing protein 3 [Elysia marginata]|uniref:Transmembrane and TPR repeat-containing protein 3 n=1 Tax=Elysia marginata TaxID=1093978 RepID=A0AAV4FR16_9GAST|nr:transmembrane and TPR repeat-containing protein 3 [Elysia marginata]